MPSLFKTAGAVLGLTFALFFAAPYAQADSYPATFTCSGTCISTPTAPEVTFSTPTTIDVTWNSFVFTIALAAPDASGDTYNWNAIPNNTRGEAVFNINDITTGLESQGVVLSSLASGTEDSGNLTFSAVAAATEPSSVALLLIGIGFALAMRKRSSGLPQSS